MLILYDYSYGLVLLLLRYCSLIWVLCRQWLEALSLTYMLGEGVLLHLKFWMMDVVGRRVATLRVTLWRWLLGHVLPLNIQRERETCTCVACKQSEKLDEDRDSDAVEWALSLLGQANSYCQRSIRALIFWVMETQPRFRMWTRCLSTMQPPRGIGPLEVLKQDHHTPSFTEAIWLLSPSSTGLCMRPQVLPNLECDCVSSSHLAIAKACHR